LNPEEGAERFCVAGSAADAKEARELRKKYTAEKKQGLAVAGELALHVDVDPRVARPVALCGDVMCGHCGNGCPGWRAKQQREANELSVVDAEWAAMGYCRADGSDDGVADAAGSQPLAVVDASGVEDDALLALDLDGIVAAASSTGSPAPQAGLTAEQMQKIARNRALALAKREERRFAVDETQLAAGATE
jgi:hypothetical protein